jgi:AraC-like DNA-binding protein
MLGLLLDLVVSRSCRSLTSGENVMVPQTFSTQPVPVFEQFEAWRRWHSPVFDVQPLRPSPDGFLATNWNWSLEGLTVSRVRSPPTTVCRPRSVIRRSPVDHWAVTVSKHSASDVAVGGTTLEAPGGAPFILSLGEEMRVTRPNHDDRLQLLLSRDHFRGIAHVLEAMKGKTLPVAQGRFLTDFMLLLEHNLPGLAPDEMFRLPHAVEAMLAACLAPSADRVTTARRQIHLTLLERVRRAVQRNLRSPSLGPDQLCREAAMSRSQLYRVLESEGGAAHYIQRLRLLESFTILCDVSNDHPIGKVAEMLCFADASSFSRAFRQEFGTTPREVRAASVAGQVRTAPRAAGAHGFADSLRGF